MVKSNFQKNCLSLGLLCIFIASLVACVPALQTLLVSTGDYVGPGGKEGARMQFCRLLDKHRAAINQDGWDVGRVRAIASDVRSLSKMSLKTHQQINDIIIAEDRRPLPSDSWDVGFAGTCLHIATTMYFMLDLLDCPYDVRIAFSTNYSSAPFVGSHADLRVYEQGKRIATLDTTIGWPSRTLLVYNFEYNTKGQYWKYVLFKPVLEYDNGPTGRGRPIPKFEKEFKQWVSQYQAEKHSFSGCRPTLKHQHLMDAEVRH